MRVETKHKLLGPDVVFQSLSTDLSSSQPGLANCHRLLHCKVLSETTQHYADLGSKLGFVWICLAFFGQEFHNINIQCGFCVHNAV